MSKCNVKPSEWEAATTIRPRTRKQKATVHYDIHLESKLERNMLTRGLGLLEQVLTRDIQVVLDATPDKWRAAKRYEFKQRWDTLQQLIQRIHASKGHVPKETK